MAKQPSDYTLAEIKDILREKKLSMIGNKAELINRLTNSDSEIWTTLDGLRSRQRHGVIDCPIDERHGSRDATAEDECQARHNDASVEDPLIENDLIRRENELLRRERALLQRELEIMRRENAESRGAPCTNTSEERRGSPPTSENVRAIRDLLSDFDGGEGTFWRWERQIQLLRTTYALDDAATRILISSKLKGRASEWFHSKPDHLTLSIEDLLASMKMFDLRQSKLSLRKKFEERTWQADESFTSYFHDKTILANRVPITDDDVIDYVIDGIPDHNLQDQARIMQFESQSDLLESFKKLTLRPKKFLDRESKKPIKENIKRKGGQRRRRIRCLKVVQCRVESSPHVERRLNVITVKKSDTWPLRVRIRRKKRERVIDAGQLVT
ncbi:SAP domain-containing protein [Camponotus japonicus]